MTIQRLFLGVARPAVASVVGRSLVHAHAHAGLRFSSTAPVTIVDGSFWRSLIPKPLRKENRRLNKKKKDWNPATYFIVMFLFIGSMSIQMIALRHQSDRYMRQASVRIAQLREVVKRIQNGEDVDVEKVLGTGDAQKETDWEEMLKAIERDEATRKPQKQEQPKQPEAQIKLISQPQTNIQQPVSVPPPPKTKTANFGNFF